MHVEEGVTHAEADVMHVEEGVTHVEAGVMRVEAGVMHVEAGVMHAPFKVHLLSFRHDCNTKRLAFLYRAIYTESEELDVVTLTLVRTVGRITNPSASW